jgi:hypothetical protein
MISGISGIERRDDAEVPAAAAHCPEQVGLVVVVDAAQLAVGRDQLDRGQRVRLEAVLAAKPANPAAERIAGDADVARGARQRRQPGLGGGICHGGPADAGAHAGTARRDVDPDLLERVGPEQERVLEALDRAGVVARPLRGDPQAALCGIADRLGYVVGTGHAHERCRPLVVGEVEGLAGGVPGLVALGEDLAVDAGLEFGELR